MTTIVRQHVNKTHLIFICNFQDWLEPSTSWQTCWHQVKPDSLQWSCKLSGTKTCKSFTSIIFSCWSSINTAISYGQKVWQIGGWIGSLTLHKSLAVWDGHWSQVWMETTWLLNVVWPSLNDCGGCITGDAICMWWNHQDTSWGSMTIFSYYFFCASHMTVA